MTGTARPLPAVIPPATAEHPSAIHASLGFLLAAAVDENFSGQDFYIEHSFVGGYYCHFGVDYRLKGSDLVTLTEALNRYTQGTIPLELLELDSQPLRDRFTSQGRSDKLEILDRLSRGKIPAARYNGYIDYRFEPMTNDLSRLQSFGLDPYDQGFVLRFPGLLPPYEVALFQDSPKLYQIIRQRQHWGRALHINNLRQLNQVLGQSDYWETVMVAEALHEKEVAEIAGGLANRPDQRLIFISGPSSSGKTTFSKRLAIQLKVLGINTLSLSMDSYFTDRVNLTPGADGEYDYEGLEALNVGRLSADLEALLAGRKIDERSYSFKTGVSTPTGRKMTLPDDTLLIVEGIHGLNPVFPENLGSGNLQRIYVSAITQLNIDNEHRVSSSDSRLLRRMVRDRQFRGYTADDTILRWPAVRLGEEQHIFAYQEAADFMFNSSLIYELAALREPAESLLKEVKIDSQAYSEAQRLLTFLAFVEPIDNAVVPRNSIIREFLGGSAFVY